MAGATRRRTAGEGSAVAVYLAAGAFFAALAARGFLVPLRANELGADRLTVGLLFSVSTLAAAALSIPAGFLADRLGHRAMVVVSSLLGGVTQLAIALTADVHLYLLWQLIGGLGGGAAQAALYAAVADAAAGHRLGRSIGWLTLSMQVGFLSGPALSGLLLQATGYAADLGITTGLYLLAVLAAPFFPARERRARGWNVAAPLRQMAARPGFVPVVVGLFGATMLWGTSQAFLPLFAKEVLLLPGAAIGFLVAIQAVANGLSRVPSGRLVDSATRKGGLVAVGMIAYALAIVVLPYLRGFWLPALVLAAAVPFLATAFVALGVAFSDMAPEAGRGIAMGVYSAVLFLGLAAGPALFGAVMTAAGYTVGFVAAGAVAVLFSLAMLASRALTTRAPSQAKT